MSEKSILTDDRFALETTGIVVESLDPVRCSLTVEDKHKNARDVVMGGAIFTLADYAFSVSMNHEKAGTVTLNGQIDYLRAADGEKLIATVIPIKNGRSTGVSRVVITDEKDREIAQATFTGIHLNG